jgi:hypothetical protein
MLMYAHVKEFLTSQDNDPRVRKTLIFIKAEEDPLSVQTYFLEAAIGIPHLFPH